MRFVTLITVLALAGPSRAMAAECDGSGNQMELNACAARDYAASDVLLNQTYRKMTTRLRQHSQSKRDAELLKIAQRAWLTFRDAQCAFVGDEYEGGSAKSMIVNTCLRQITLQRVKELEASLEGP